MKTVVIIENEALELEAMVSLFEQWQEEINILTAAEEKAAINIMSQHDVDLVVCDLAMSKNDNLQGFTLLTHTFPYIPCIALSAAKGASPAEAIRRGASHCLEKPVDANQLLLHAGDLLETSTSGTVRGIPIHSFLQMLETEEKTCTLRIDKPGDIGLLYIQNGVLIGAETKNFTGEEAAHLILSWQETVVQIRHFNGQRKRQINKPLISIIMEAFRIRNRKEKEEAAKPHQLPLKHLSTQGRRIPLKIGSRVKLEFPHLDSLVECVMVGMLQDHFLIVTNPQPFADLAEKLGVTERVIFKYVHKGRLWMFKTQLLNSVASPSPLFFFEYPGVIHFHELREAKRSAIIIPCTFHLPDKPVLYGALSDLSLSGALCQIRHKGASALPRIDIGDKIVLRCLLPGVKEEQIVGGTVRNLQVVTEATRIGIEFESLQQHLSDTIGNYLYAMEDQEE